MEVQSPTEYAQATRVDQPRHWARNFIRKFGFIVGLLTLGYQEKGVMKQRFDIAYSW